MPIRELQIGKPATEIPGGTINKVIRAVNQLQAQRLPRKRRRRGGSGSGGAAGPTVLVDWPIAAATAVLPVESLDWNQTSVSLGTLTLPPHNYKVNDLVNAVWDIALGNVNERTGLTVTAVSGENVTISGGTGEDLPPDGTPIQIGPFFIRPTTAGCKVLSGADERPTRGSQLEAVLTTRNSNDVGELTMGDSGHGLLVGEELFLFFTDSGAKFSRCRVTAVDDLAVDIIRDEEYNVLPPDETAIVVTHYAAIEVSNYWDQSINPGTHKAFRMKTETQDGVNKLLVWSCASTGTFKHTPLPPE
jgi:hypothetical protein